MLSHIPTNTGSVGDVGSWESEELWGVRNNENWDLEGSIPSTSLEIVPFWKGFLAKILRLMAVTAVHGFDYMGISSHPKLLHF